MKVCIFGASSENIDEQYKQSVYQLGKALAQDGHHLVFGGGKSGLMGQAAKGFKDGGGRIIGIAPVIFDSEEILFDCDEKIITTNLVDRKEKMLELADAFVCVAGGIGTYDELFEVLSSKQLEYHHKPIILYNTLGYYNKLVGFLNDTYTTGFMNEKSLHIYQVCDQAKQVVELLKGDK